MKRAARGEAMAEARESVPVVPGAMVSGATSGLAVTGGPGALDSSAGAEAGAAPVVAASSSASALGSWPSQTLPIGQLLQA